MARRKKGRKGGNSRPAPREQIHEQRPQAAGDPTKAQGDGRTAGEAPAVASRSQAQKRAEHALEKVRALQGSAHGNYASYVNALPARIIMNGLGQALAMERASGDKDAGHKLLFRHMQDWLLNGWERGPYKGQTDILKAIVSGTEADYIRAQGEAMAYLEWLKKLAAAFLKEQEGDDAGSAA